jgi:hypothetical protein
MEMSIERPLVDLYMLSRDPAFVSLKQNSKEPIGNAWQKNQVHLNWCIMHSKRTVTMLV